jgi:hypothetical protein
LRGSSGIGDVGCDPPGFVAGEEVRRRATVRLLLEVNVGQRLTVGAADYEAGVGLVAVHGGGNRRGGTLALCGALLLAAQRGGHREQYLISFHGMSQPMELSCRSHIPIAAEGFR